MRGSLVENGWFLNMDQVLGETPEEEAFFEEWWLRGAREAGATDEDLAAAFRRMRADKSATLKDQLRWLKEAGFEDVERLHEDHRFAVYGGRRGEVPTEGKEGG